MTMPATLTAAARVSRSVMLLSASIGIVLAGTLALWGYYGTTVFFEMVRAGWIACF
jgi:hypothetical protein